MLPRIILHKGKEISLLRRHPWIFSGAIRQKDDGLTDGTVVEVYSADKKYLATGFYANGSIAVRVISFQERPIDQSFWNDVISRAWNYRRSLPLLNENTNSCRLFFGEGDGVPGLVIDLYDGNLVLQSHTPGVYLQREKIAQALLETDGLTVNSIYDKSADTLNLKSGPVTNGFLHGSAGEITIRENGHSFLLDLVKGQKTGFFLDQRENRQKLANWSKGKKVLNTFCYTGGFSVYAGGGGASLVDSVDISAPAIEMCRRNMEVNGLSPEGCHAADTFEFMKDRKNEYDLIVLDPPAFAKHRDSRHQAVIGYKRLNAMAMKNIRKGGIIFTFSCSGVVDKALFYNTIAAATMESGRNVKVLDILSQPMDHPVVPQFSEGEYLKGMVLWVE